MHPLFRPGAVARVCAVAALLLSTIPFAYAQTPQNPIIINSVPVTITTSGYYRLGNNFLYTPPNNNTVAIIQVDTSNVTIDFNGFFIAGPQSNPANQVVGIQANERSNLSILNGTIAYCFKGISITGNGLSTTNNLGHRIERMRVPRCYYIGIEVINALTTEITDNQVNFTGGTTVFGANTSIFGIYTNNGSPTITNNKVSTITGVGTGTGWGIYCLNTSKTFVVMNKIDTADNGLRMLSAQGKYQDNLTGNCTTPFAGGVDAGGNN